MKHNIVQFDVEQNKSMNIQENTDYVLQCFQMQWEFHTLKD